MVSTTSTAGRRLGAVALDQAVSSASNLLITILAARMLDPVAFGLFGAVVLVFMTTQGLARAIVAEPLLVRPQESEDRPGEAIGAGLVVGVATGLVVTLGGVVALAFDGPLGASLLVLGVASPMLVLQDLGRFLGFATHRPSRALALDVGWFALQLVTVGVLVAAGVDDLVWFVVAWTGAGALAALPLLWQVRGHPIRLSLGWVRETWEFSWRYTVAFGSRQGGVLAASAAAAAILGAQALGALRGALVLYGPLVQIQAASVAAGVTEVARLPVDSPELRRHLTRTTTFTTLVALANVAALVALPDSIGELLLGDTWPAAERLLLPVGLQMVGLSLISGVRAGLLGMRALQRTLRLDLLSVASNLGTVLAVAPFSDVETVFWWRAVVQFVVAACWWVAYRRQRRTGPVVDAAPAVPVVG